jgi:Na/Pi-cotransporter
MTTFQIIIAAVAAIVLFLHGLQGLSHELQIVGGERLQRWLGRFTANRLRGFIAGALATAAVQSSSATTALTVTLVDSSVISFWASLGIVLGANVGTTTTAWLVSFKLTGVGPFFIVLGTLISAIPVRASVAGKAVFYFGVIFFALDLISSALQPLRSHPFFQEWLLLADVPWRGVLIGLVFTAIIQSSSVTTGLAILLVQQGILPMHAAIPIVIGANVGSTSTGLVSSIGMKSAARATAIANFCFNAVGVLLFLPFLQSFSLLMVNSFERPDMAVAWAHLIFNLTVGVFFLILLGIFESRLRRWFPLDSPPKPIIPPVPALRDYTD